MKRLVARLPRPEVHPRGVVLHHVYFADRPGAEGGAPEQAGFSLDLQVARASPLELRVALALTGEPGLPFELSVVYAAHFEMEAGVLEALRDEHWRDVASWHAPEILFPYMRELVANLTLRWGEEPLVLPADRELLRFSPEAVEIPPPPVV